MKNTSDLKRYMDDLKAGKPPVEASMHVSREEAIKEFIFLGLRKREGLDIGMLKEEFGIDLPTMPDQLSREGLLTSNGTHVSLTRKGIVVSNTVITELFTLLRPD